MSAPAGTVAYRVTLKAGRITVAYIGRGATREEAIADARAQARSWSATGQSRWTLVSAEPA